jgi:methionyl-tRNA formyltransferase
MDVPVFEVENYHSDESLQLLSKADADLGILYGTNIVRESVFSIPRLGSINIHQGLAPMYRGGPPVFWELFNGEKEVGITVHFVAAAVDAGEIVMQTTVPLAYDHAKYGSDYESFLSDFRASLLEPSAELLAEAVRQIANGEEQRIKQDITAGKRYKLPVKAEKDKLLRILNKRLAA